MAIYLVRHGHAGARGTWTGDDAQRPLSPKGWRQSNHLVKALDGADVGRVFASPARRCIETVTPVANAFGLTVEERRELFEGQDGTEAWALALKHADHNPMLCSHGDVIPAILRRLHESGLRAPDSHLCEKGSMWAIKLKKGRIAGAAYHPPGR